jgi:spore coat protein U-like protein
MKKLFKFQVPLFFALTSIFGTSQATSLTTTWNSTITSVAGCIISSSSGIFFGNYSSGSPLNINGTVQFLCTTTTPWTISSNAGTTSGGTIPNRLLANGSNTLPYQLYTDSTYTTIFGNGTSGSSFTGVFDNGYKTLTIYGKVPSGNYPLPGSYSDSITITLTY